MLEKDLVVANNEWLCVCRKKISFLFKTAINHTKIVYISPCSKHKRNKDPGISAKRLNDNLGGF